MQKNNGQLPLFKYYFHRFWRWANSRHTILFCSGEIFGSISICTFKSNVSVLCLKNGSILVKLPGNELLNSSLIDEFGCWCLRISKAVQCSNMRVGTLGAAPTRHCHTQPFSRIRNHQFLPKTPYWGRNTALKRHASNSAIWDDTLWRTASKQLRKNKTPYNCSGENCKPALVRG